MLILYMTPEWVGSLFRSRMKGAQGDISCAKDALVGRKGKFVRLRRVFWLCLVGRVGSAALKVVQVDRLFELGPVYLVHLRSASRRFSQPTEGNEVRDDLDASRQRLLARQHFRGWAKKGVGDSLVFLAPEGRRRRRPIILQLGGSDVAWIHSHHGINLLVDFQDWHGAVVCFFDLVPTLTTELLSSAADRLAQLAMALVHLGASRARERLPSKANLPGKSLSLPT
jgi:hypothetical protein